MSKSSKALVLLRGGGDLATGVALRLRRAGMRVVIAELAQPLAVRRTVSFAEAVYAGHHTVEGVTARFIQRDHLSAALDADEIPVLVDPGAEILPSTFHFPVVIDARLLKAPPAPLPVPVPLHIGLGPGFHAGRDCHAVIETRRSHTMGRVYWDGTTQPDSREPEGDPRRVLRAPGDGVVISHANIGDHLDEGQLIAEIQPETLALHASAGVGNRKPVLSEVEASEIVSPFKGVLRGLIHPGLRVPKGLKIGDVDPRDDASACFLVSDKALAIGGGALEAILTRSDIRGLFFR
jgi:xanthine dehydrogenase accessory factor